MGTKRITCKFCGEYMKSYDSYVSHIESSHSESIPQDMTAWKFVYYLKTGKTHGSCIICKKDTEWNEKTHKYHRFCNNPKCKEKYVETFRNRMIGKYGKVNLLNDPEQQKKMLANRKISGVYTWRDHVHETPYTGTYELSFLKFLDEIMEFNPEDVIGPSPHTYYYIYDGQKHFYIPDFFIPSLNLEIEIKEGTNNHPKIQAVDKVKERLKDEVMKSNSNSFNYIKIIEKNNFRFIEFLDESKKRFLNGDKRPIVMCETVEDNLFDELITENNKFHLYHISNRQNIKTINPSIPNNFMTKNNYEENKTKRVCFAPSIEQCLMGLSRNCEGEEFYVYIPVKHYKTYSPNIKDVPDSGITGEIWIKEPVDVICLGKIKVLDTNKSPGKLYTYGNGKTAELYAFDYKWIERYKQKESLERTKNYIRDEQKVLTESVDDVTNKPIIKTKNTYMIKNDKGTIISKLNYYEYKVKNFDWILMADLDTKPDYRGKGLATKLINELYNDITKNTNKGLYMFVKSDNRTAIRLYTKLNFKKVKNYTLEDGEYIIMAKGNADMSQFDKMNFS